MLKKSIARSKHNVNKLISVVEKSNKMQISIK